MNSPFTVIVLAQVEQHMLAIAVIDASYSVVNIFCTDFREKCFIVGNLIIYSLFDAILICQIIFMGAVFHNTGDEEGITLAESIEMNSRLVVNDSIVSVGISVGSNQSAIFIQIG